MTGFVETRFQVQVPAPPPLPPLLVLEDVVLPIFGMALGAFIVWQLFRTVNRWLERRSGGAPEEVRELRAEVAQLREQAETVEDLRLRVGELEERLDFAERVLARQRERPPLESGRPEG